MAISAKMAYLAKMAEMALNSATFGIQFKSPAAGDFLPVSPFSPLHAFLDISAANGPESLNSTTSRSGLLSLLLEEVQETL